MNKIKYVSLLCLLITLSINAQTPADTINAIKYPEKEAIEKPYHPEENAEQQLNKLILKAKKEHKNIFIQAGGNWCVWCLRFNYFVHNVAELDTILSKNYLYYHLNFSPENKNEVVFSKYTEKDKRYGYPFFIILSSNGKLLHIQESDVFEAGKGYDIKKVKLFLQKWSPK